jgi:hypothetical protein
MDLKITISNLFYPSSFPEDIFLMDLKIYNTKLFYSSSFPEDLLQNYL